MKKSIKFTFALLAFLLLPMQATAEGIPELNIKPYVGGGAGAYLIGNGTGEDWVFGGYGLVGAELIEYLALEVRFGSTAEGENPNSKFGTDYFISYLAKPQLRMHRDVYLYGLVGASTIKSWSTPTGGTKVTKTNTSFSIGGGIEYLINDNISIGAEGLFMETEDKTGKAVYEGNYMGSATATVQIRF
jgi:opacity protein-like surface antigen